jgi:hypothetical protein
MRLDEIGDDVGRGIEDVLAPLSTFEDVAAKRVDRFPLLVHDVVVLEQVFADLEVASFDLPLSALDRATDHAVLDGDALFHAEALHEARDAIGAEDPHQIVFERKVEARRARISLTSRTAAELVVDAA